MCTPKKAGKIEEIQIWLLAEIYVTHVGGDIEKKTWQVVEKNW